MSTAVVRCGQISYINVLPLFYPLEEGIVTHPFLFINAPPAVLNKKIRLGELDVSPVSSVEYILYASQYRILPDLSISANNKVMSVLLFSYLPIEELDGQEIALSTESNTSVLLLRLLCNAYFAITPRYVNLDSTTWNNAKAMLLIGDSALHEHNKRRYAYVYDLAQIWHQWTQLPFVFALWIAPSTSSYSAHVLASPFYNARAWSEEHIITLCNRAKEISTITDKTLKEYYASLTYCFGKQEEASMRYFIELLYTYKYIATKPQLQFLE